MTRALILWLLAAVTVALSAILAVVLGWRTLATLDDAWDVHVDAPRLLAQPLRVSGAIHVTDAYTGKRSGSVFDDDAFAFRMAERMAMGTIIAVPPYGASGSPA